MGALCEGSVEGMVTWMEFLDYYKAVSAMVGNDKDFFECVHAVWKYPAYDPPGAAAPSAAAEESKR